MAKKLIDDEEIGTAGETPDGNAGVSGRSEREIEALAGDDDDEGEGEEDRAADDTGDADTNKVVAGLRKRLGKLTAQRNTAREALKERDALKARVDAYERAERDAERARQEAARRTPEGQAAEERKRAVRETIDEVYGPGTSEILEEQREERERQKEEYAMRGISFLKRELDDRGLKYDDELLVRYERAVGSELAEDKQLANQFRRPSTQEAAIKEALDRHLTIVDSVLEQRGAKPLERINRNREALLGGTQRPSSAEGLPEPEFNLKPPKGLSGRELDDWWRQARDNYRGSLPAE